MGVFLVSLRTRASTGAYAGLYEICAHKFYGSCRLVSSTLDGTAKCASPSPPQQSHFLFLFAPHFPTSWPEPGFSIEIEIFLFLIQVARDQDMVVTLSKYIQKISSRLALNILARMYRGRDLIALINIYARVFPICTLWLQFSYQQRARIYTWIYLDCCISDTTSSGNPHKT